jgi:hypothetical protein
MVICSHLWSFIVGSKNNYFQKGDWKFRWQFKAKLNVVRSDVPWDGAS